MKALSKDPIEQFINKIVAQLSERTESQKLIALVNEHETESHTETNWQSRQRDKLRKRSESRPDFPDVPFEPQNPNRDIPASNLITGTLTCAIFVLIVLFILAAFIGLIIKFATN